PDAPSGEALALGSSRAAAPSATTLPAAIAALRFGIRLCLKLLDLLGGDRSRAAVRQRWGAWMAGGTHEPGGAFNPVRGRSVDGPDPAGSLPRSGPGRPALRATLRDGAGTFRGGEGAESWLQRICTARAQGGHGNGNAPGARWPGHAFATGVPGSAREGARGRTGRCGGPCEEVAGAPCRGLHRWMPQGRNLPGERPV